MRKPIALAMLTVLTLPVVCHAGSIWAKSNVRAQALYTDDTARKIGDSITIVIQERGVIKNETSRNLEKSSDSSAKVTGKADYLRAVDNLTGKLFNLSGTDQLNVTASAKNNFEGSAQFDSDRSVKDEVTVTVQDVLPNGNMVVQGERQREVEGDAQVVQVSGVVRPSDISFNNQVSSEKIADFNVVYKHRGQENSFTNPGWLSRIMNFLNPF